MKTIILTLALTFIALTASSQCDCQKIYRDDGTTVTQCNPSPVAHDNSTQIGLAAASNGQNQFVSITVRFKSSAQKITGDLSLRLSNNNMISLELVNSGLSVIGNNQVAQGIFLANKTAIAKLKQSDIKTISFKLQDGLLRTYNTELNTSVLKDQFRCI